MKTKIEEEENFYGGNARPAAAKFEVRIVFDEPFYQRCPPGEQVQGAGILSPAGAGGAATGSHVVVASVSGKTRAFSPDNAVLEVRCAIALMYSTFLLSRSLGNRAVAVISWGLRKCHAFSA
jgi:hypothetical protein